MRIARFASAVGLLSFTLAPIPAEAKPGPIRAIIWTAPQCNATAGSTKTFAFLPALLSLVVAPIIKASLTAAGDALQKAGAPHDLVQTSGSTETYFYSAGFRQPADSANPPAVAPDTPTDFTNWKSPNNAANLDLTDSAITFRHGCIAMIFGPATKDDVHEAAITRGLAASYDAAGTAPLDKNGGKLAENVSSTVAQHIDVARASIMVAQYEQSADATAFRLVPTYIKFGPSLKDGRSAKRGLAFSFNLIPPGGASEGTAVAVRSIGIADLTTPLELSTDEAAAYATSWMPLPAMSENATARIAAAAKRRSDRQALQQSIAGGKLKPAELAKARADAQKLEPLIRLDDAAISRLSPYTVRGEIHESTDGSKLLAALGKVLSDNADKASTTFTDAIDPEKRAKAKEADAEALDTLRLNAIQAEADLAAAITANNVSGQRSAQIKLDAACRQISAAGFAELSCVSAQ